MKIYIWHGGDLDGQIASKAEVDELGKNNPCFEVWTLQAASEVAYDAGPHVTPRAMKIAERILERFAHRGSERAERALPHLKRALQDEIQ